MKFILMLVFCVSLISCGSSTIDVKELIKSGDMLFLKKTNEVFTGTAITYDDKTKNKIEEVNYVEGVPHGKAKGWYSNGNLSYEASFKEGKLVSSKGWNEDGSEKDTD